MKAADGVQNSSSKFRGNLILYIEESLNFPLRSTVSALMSFNCPNEASVVCSSSPWLVFLPWLRRRSWWSPGRCQWRRPWWLQSWKRRGQQQSSVTLLQAPKYTFTTEKHPHCQRKQESEMWLSTTHWVNYVIIKTDSHNHWQCSDDDTHA